MKRLYLASAAAGALVLPIFAFALVDVTAEEVTLTLPEDGSSYTLTGDSFFDEVVLSGPNIVFTMSANQRVVLKSADRKKLTNTKNTNTQCNTSESTLTLETGVDESSQTITVTPTGTCGGGSGGIGSGGGGGGGSGGGGSSATPYVSPSETKTAAVSQATTLADLQQRLNELLKQVLAQAGAAGAITKSLSRGSTGDEVRALQSVLAKDAEVYPLGTVNGIFGPATEAAVKKFQEKYGIAEPGDPGYGTVGPKTRAKVNELAGMPSSAPASQPAPVSGGSPGVITRSLSFGARSAEVSTLQTILAQDPEVYPDGLVTGYFGRLTLEAVKRFQIKYGIAAEDDPGYGNVGPKTRAKANEFSSM